MLVLVAGYEGEAGAQEAPATGAVRLVVPPPQPAGAPRPLVPAAAVILPLAQPPARSPARALTTGAAPAIGRGTTEPSSLVQAAADAGAPAAGPAVPPTVDASVAKQAAPSPRVRRRDPLEPPLQERDAWRELILTVRLNGAAVSDAALFAENPADGSLYVQLAAIQAWRLKLDPLRIITLHGEPYYPLAAVRDLKSTLNRDELTLQLDVPPDEFAPTRVVPDRQPAIPPPRAGKGAFLDYDVAGEAGDGFDPRLGALVELGAFGDPGTLLSSFKLGDLGGGGGLVRLETTLTRDLPDRHASLRLGDSLTNGGAFARSVRFAGLQYATNFATDPSFVTFPLPSIGGLAAQPAVVDVLVDNLQRVRGQVPPGPFAIDNLPVVTGAGEVQLKVKDLLGRERVVTQPYYVSSRILKAGLQDFAYEVGAERRDYGSTSFDYGPPLAALTHRYGFTDALTGEVHLEAEPDLVGVTAGGSGLLGNWGVLTAGVGASGHDGAGGGMVELGYEYAGRPFSFGARTRFESPSFAQVGYAGGDRRIDQVNLGLDLGDAGTLGLLFLDRDSADGDDLASFAATWSLPAGPGALSLRAAEFVAPDQDLALTAVYSLPLGPTRSASSEVERRDHDLRTRAQFRQTRGASDLGLDYRLGVDAGDLGPGADTRFSYQTARLGTDLEAQHEDGHNDLRAGVNGSLAVLDGNFAASRRVGRAFGLVDLPGFPDVRVYLDNHEAGRTDADGRLMLPDLRPYEPNRVRLAVEDLPLDARIGSDEVTAVPYARSGVGVGFDVTRRRQATASLRDASARALPPGLVLASADGRTTATVGRNGFSQLDGLRDQPVRVHAVLGRRPYDCVLPPLGGGDPLPDLGVLECE